MIMVLGFFLIYETFLNNVVFLHGYFFYYEKKNHKNKIYLMFQTFPPVTYSSQMCFCYNYWTDKTITIQNIFDYTGQGKERQN